MMLGSPHREERLINEPAVHIPSQNRPEERPREESATQMLQWARYASKGYCSVSRIYDPSYLNEVCSFSSLFLFNKRFMSQPTKPLLPAKTVLDKLSCPLFTSYFLSWRTVVMHLTPADHWSLDPYSCLGKFLRGGTRGSSPVAPQWHAQTSHGIFWTEPITRLIIQHWICSPHVHL